MAIDVKPVPRLAHKPAALVQARGAAGFAQADDKLDFGMVGTRCDCTSKPLMALIFAEFRLGKHLKFMASATRQKMF